MAQVESDRSGAREKKSGKCQNLEPVRTVTKRESKGTLGQTTSPVLSAKVKEQEKKIKMQRRLRHGGARKGNAPRTRGGDGQEHSLRGLPARAPRPRVACTVRESQAPPQHMASLSKLKPRLPREAGK